MPKSKYYRVLGLSPTASEQEIRKTYRILVMKFHPDKNNSVGAEDKFLEIKEAYEILTGKKNLPKSRIEVSSNKTKNEKEERLKVAKKRFEDSKRKEILENERYYQSLTTGYKWRIVRISAIIGIILNISMLLDYVLPKHYKQDIVTHYALFCAASLNGTPLSIIQTKDESRFWVSNITYNLYNNAPEILVEESWLLHNPSRIIVSKDLENIYYDIYFNAYKNGIILMSFFSIPLFTLFYKRKSIKFTILFHLSFYIVNGVILYFLLTNDRWLHLLTLGFI